MLTVSLSEFDPYEMAKNILQLPESDQIYDLSKIKNVKVDIESGRVTFCMDDISNGILNFVGTRPITSVTNLSNGEVIPKQVLNNNLVGVTTASDKIVKETYSPVFSSTPKKSYQTSGVQTANRSNLSNKDKTGDSKSFSKKPAKMSLWMVDFGRPVGCEFGYEHPAILCEETSPGLWNVLPCTTKLWDEKEVLELCFADQNVLKNKNPNFVAKPISNVLIKEQKSVSSKRFIEYLGDIGEDYHEVIERCYKRGMLNKDISFVLEDLEFSPKQLMLLDGKELEIVEIGNDNSITYYEKVKKILNLLGFYPDADEAASYLMEALAQTKLSTNINSKKLFAEISKRKLISAGAIQGMVTALLKKKYKDLYPCFELFLRTINKIAYYR